MPPNELYIIAGCNGAGKTTASFTILPEILDCIEFVNADEIAKGLSPFQPELVSLDAGRIMLARINTLLDEQRTFDFETTLATKSYRQKILRAQADGYVVTLLFFWLQDVGIAKERVATRVHEGGHNIASAIIERRYKAGVRNLFNIYLPIVDGALIFDNSNGIHKLIAKQSTGDQLEILEPLLYTKLKDSNDKE